MDQISNLNDENNEEDNPQLWYTEFTWKFDCNHDFRCQITSQKSTPKRPIFYGVPHENEAECIGLTRLMNRILEPLRDGIGYPASFEFYIARYKIFEKLSNGGWSPEERANFDKKCSPEELLVLSQKRVYPVDLNYDALTLGNAASIGKS